MLIKLSSTAAATFGELKLMTLTAVRDERILWQTDFVILHYTVEYT